MDLLLGGFVIVPASFSYDQEGSGSATFYNGIIIGWFCCCSRFFLCSGRFQFGHLLFFSCSFYSVLPSKPANTSHLKQICTVLSLITILIYTFMFANSKIYSINIMHCFGLLQILKDMDRYTGQLLDLAFKLKFNCAFFLSSLCPFGLVF